MAEPSKEQSRLKELATTIVNWPQDQLLHPTKAPGLNFDATKRVFDALQGFYRQVLQASFDWLPGDILNDMVTAAEGVIQVFTQVQDFSFQIYDPQNQRNSTAGR